MSKKFKQPIKTVCLEDILKSFNSSIKEEHAWALCYQCIKYYLENRSEHCFVPTEVDHIYLQSDGNIHPDTLHRNTSDNRKPLTDNDELVSGLGCIIYSALDRGFNNSEERAIGRDLEQLMSDMITDEKSLCEERHHETDDEGIERDSEEADSEQPSCSMQNITKISLEEVLKRCERHLGNLSKAQVETHYRAVVRALVAEALELATFLEKVAQGTSALRGSTADGRPSDLDQLQFADWARFWVQVIGELRMGVKLKKVRYSRAPIEYELTPYEILMKDIRSCRYNLRKIMVNGNIPSRVTKDAHAIILEFIRSRPPLKKASDRKLAPYSRALTPREQLMNSIKKGRTLRPTATKFSRSPTVDCDPSTKPEGSGRRLIKVDFSQLRDDDDDDDEEDDDRSCTSPCSDSPGLWPQEEYHQLYETTLAAYDLATDPNAISCRRNNTLRVHPFDLGTQSVPQSRPCSRQSCNSSEAESLQLEPEIAKAMQDELTSSNRSWHETMSLDDRLSLTLEEIVHIRSVLTKAELETLPVEGHIKTDVENRKVCFLCLKTRFGIFGPWGQRCALCKRTVCSKCYSKMSIPMEYFSSVPVVLLSPSIMATPEEERSPSRQSPSGSRPSSSMEGSVHSEGGSAALSRFKSRAIAVGRAAAAVEKLKADMMVVCQDCKMMVLQIIKTARVNRSEIRNKTLQNLTLNLSPVF